MSIPEGYTTAPTTTDHMVQLAIPVPGRDDPILVHAPRLAWLPPEDVDAYSDWMKPYLEAENEVTEWQNANDELDKAVATARAELGSVEASRADFADAESYDEAVQAARAKLDEAESAERAPFPQAAQDLVAKLTVRETKVRWLKKYLSPADYKTLATSKKIPERTIDWIVDQLRASSDITPGESGASDDS
ncbi:hypothetical protein [Williamsia deligens]|uniref:Tail assembly chaperone n=1 Tax=Williamsia deligens TaxID=321325 RepID=A0ABW3GC03_9NOCA|nr:hypothetical protein [Williamsia deligens]MCP2196284.1 hypothetical protein [Williamsia deligens]